MHTTLSIHHCAMVFSLSDVQIVKIVDMHDVGNTAYIIYLFTNMNT